MYGKTIDKLGTEINMELCIDKLDELPFMEITKIDKTPMPRWCAEVFFKSTKGYCEIREIIDNLRSRGYYMMLVSGFYGEDSILISNIYEKVGGK